MLSNVVASQAAIHARYGGVVPEVASRHHIEAMLPVVKAALAEAKCRPDDLDAVAVTAGPGLAGSLLVGLNTAKALAYAWDKPLIGVNHLEGHIYANWLPEAEPPSLRRCAASCLPIRRSDDRIARIGRCGDSIPMPPASCLRCSDRCTRRTT